MKTARTTSEIISALQNAKHKYGEENVERAIYSLLGWYHTFRKEDWQITVAKRYVFVALKTASHPMAEADMIFDMEEGMAIRDSRGLLNWDEPEVGFATSLSTLARR